MEGGSTVIDPDGDIWKKGTEYQKKYPDAAFEEFEKNCFPGMDGNLKLIAISPRHLECCATKTCQVLIEGYYNGILKANEHYIPLKSDFSNLDEVFTKMKDEKMGRETAKRAYKDIVLSKNFTYSSYVKFVIESSGVKSNPRGLYQYLRLKNYYYQNRLSEKNYWSRKHSHQFPNDKTLRNILIRIYTASGLLKLKQLIYR